VERKASKSIDIFQIQQSAVRKKAGGTLHFVFVDPFMKPD